jgi:hypothetical protein
MGESRIKSTGGTMLQQICNNSVFNRSQYTHLVIPGSVLSCQLQTPIVFATSPSSSFNLQLENLTQSIWLSRECQRILRSEQEKKEGLNFRNIPRTSSQGELSLPGTPVTHRSSRANQLCSRYRGRKFLASRVHLLKVCSRHR